MAKLKGKAKIEQRKMLAEQKKQGYKQTEEKRNFEKIAKEEAERALVEERRIKSLIERIEGENPNYAKVKKSKAKAAGLKSTFIMSENELLMTSFGRGNEALVDKYIKNEVISDASNQALLDVVNNEHNFKVSGRLVKDAPVDNPLMTNKNAGMDQIKCKDKLEKMYFGKEFEDNIHIQLIYKILDIEKILAVHVNNIVYELNNMARTSELDYADLIGYLSDRKKFAEYKKTEYYPFFVKMISNKQMAYFGDMFVAPVKSKGMSDGEYEKKIEKYTERCYNLLVVVGMIRQATAHGQEESRSNIYRLDELTKLSGSETELDNLYKNRIMKLNKEFGDNSGKDVSILCSVFDAKNDAERERIAKELYSFVVTKSYKNMGFSIKRVRENLAVIETGLKDKKYDTVRHKLNKILVFVIWDYYKNNIDRTEKLVDKLRATSKESEKELIYREEAKVLWNSIGDNVERKILPKMNGDYIASLNKDVIPAEVFENVSIGLEANTFSKMIYLLTIFLDGKEINDLLTQLISNFENIDSFMQVMKTKNIEVKFNNKYSMFEESKKISEELRVINSFARMSKPDPVAKKAMFIEAATLLGYSQDEEALGEYFDKMLSKSNKDKNFRNFIINNVIDSSRFQYLVRYGNPKVLRNMANNKAVVDFVLREIPDDQIRFYYNSCNGVEKGYSDNMREDLANKIVGLSFFDFEKVQQRTNNEDKERKKNIVRLYLTVLYLLVKNLVYINSRYFLAFHCVERDALIYDSHTYGKGKIDGIDNPKSVLTGDKRAFAIDFVNEHSTNTRAKRYINENFNNSDEWSVRKFRNCVDHLNAVRNADKYIDDAKSFNSYFELYHYLVQRSIIAQFDFDESKNYISKEELNSKTLKYWELIGKYGSYCKDYVKAYNVPFAYNLARYKNLSINELFDRNNYLPNKGQKEWLDREY